MNGDASVAVADAADQHWVESARSLVAALLMMAEPSVAELEVAASIARDLIPVVER
jgi:hypothetical protein